MDSGSSIKDEKKSKKINNFLNVGDVLQPVWLRRNSDIINEVNRIILWGQLSIVLPFGFMFWIILLIFW
jgi:hypothetical protein